MPHRNHNIITYGKVLNKDKLFPTRNVYVPDLNPFLKICFNLKHILLPWAEVTVTQSLSPDGMLLTELKTVLKKEYNLTGTTVFKPVPLAEM